MINLLLFLLWSGYRYIYNDLDAEISATESSLIREGRLIVHRITTMEIPSICQSLRHSYSKRDLAESIHYQVTQFSPYDLLHLRGILEKELKYLPTQYKKRLFPKLIEQVFGTHHMLLLMFRERQFINFNDPLPNNFYEFCDMVEQVCRESTTPMHPRFTLLYYLLSAFSMFVLELPGHPVGTPFPGGFTVEKIGTVYLCPIRDKENDVESAICRFCPAKQA